MNTAVHALTAKASGELPDYLRTLGYEVDWDFRHGLGRWWEVYDGERMVFQIDDWTTLASFRAEMPQLVEARKAGRSTPSEKVADQEPWECRLPRLSDGVELVRRMRSA